MAKLGDAVSRGRKLICLRAQSLERTLYTKRVVTGALGHLNEEVKVKGT